MYKRFNAWERKMTAVAARKMAFHKCPFCCEGFATFEFNVAVPCFNVICGTCNTNFALVNDIQFCVNCEINCPEKKVVVDGTQIIF